MSQFTINTIPRLKNESGLTWADLSILTGINDRTLKRYATDWAGQYHILVNGCVFTKTTGQDIKTKQAGAIDFTKRLINIMAAKGMMEDEIADRLGMEDEEVEQAINDVFVDAAKSAGADIVKHDYQNASRLRPKRPRRKKKAP